MNYYELTCLISPDISETELPEVSDKIKQIITENSGKIEEASISPKRKTVYLANGLTEKMFLFVSFFQFPEGNIEKLKKTIKEEKNIFRYLLLKKKKKPKLSPKKIRKNKEDSDKKPAKEEKADLNELDKKIDEILNND